MLPHPASAQPNQGILLHRPAGMGILSAGRAVAEPGGCDTHPTMFLSLAIILSVGAVSVYFTDLNSETALHSLFLPIIDLFSFLALALWIVIFLHRRGIQQSTAGGASGVSGGFINGGSGGDGGC